MLYFRYLDHKPTGFASFEGRVERLDNGLGVGLPPSDTTEAEKDYKKMGKVFHSSRKAVTGGFKRTLDPGNISGGGTS